MEEGEGLDVKLTAGSRWRSVVDTTEVVVVKAPQDDVDLRCGGQSMVAFGSEGEASGAIDPSQSAGTQLGKRYCHEDGGLEVLCTKPGEGTLSLAGQALNIKSAKPLPSSD
jgi:hypothetical protein